MFPLVVQALRVEQTLGVFYVAVIPAGLVLEVCYSDTLHAAAKHGGRGYELAGTQRNLDTKRLKLISEFIDRSDSAFPNSIILAANQRVEDGFIEEESEDIENLSRWTIEEKKTSFYLTIPTKRKLAAIIDGQHRLFAFAYADTTKLNTDLICSIFIDLPKPIQAQIFATINSTQKPVSKSLTYELFGYNVEEESEEYWAPDKLAVFLSRKLATSSESRLLGKIVVAPERDAALDEIADKHSWRVSTAVVVEGIIRLISTNPKRDANALMENSRKNRRVLGTLRLDKSPLRKAYITSEDLVIYTLVVNYLQACHEVFWSKASPDSFIIKTVGVQALFDILKEHAAAAYEDHDIRVIRFVRILEPGSDIDFASDFFRNASGAGRSTIRNAIRNALIASEAIKVSTAKSH